MLLTVLQVSKLQWVGGLPYRCLNLVTCQRVGPSMCFDVLPVLWLMLPFPVADALYDTTENKIPKGFCIVQRREAILLGSYTALYGRKFPRYEYLAVSVGGEVPKGYSTISVWQYSQVYEALKTFRYDLIQLPTIRSHKDVIRYTNLGVRTSVCRRHPNHPITNQYPIQGVRQLNIYCPYHFLIINSGEEPERLFQLHI